MSPFRVTRRFVLSTFVFILGIWLFYTMVMSVDHQREEVIEVQEDQAVVVQGLQQNGSVVAALTAPEISVDPSSAIVTLRLLVAERNALAVQKLNALAATKTFRYVIVVQIHDRVTYIRALLESLAATRNIADALVILSLDVISEEIESLVKSFGSSLQTVQIYFPYSIELYPNEFPGASKQDCPERVGKPEATKRKCTSHDHPDSYGNYRTPGLSQVKHHWWWKFYFVFTQLSLARTNIPVLFAEDDHYVMPDALYMLDELYKLRETACSPRCHVVSVAHHKVKLADGKESYKKYFAGQWVGSRDNIGIVFDYDQFKTINTCANTFCEIDDYNWDWSLHFLITRCLKKEYNMLVPMAPRVLHIGDCGGIHHKSTCNPEKYVKQAQQQVLELTDSLFPEKLSRTSQALLKPRDAKVNGGWGDPRDHNLCRNIFSTFFQATVNPVP
ncbi:Alpha-1,6-mannosyl-glycoprotein 2-beta-N-acetylglucosaminyltransferase [Hypsibius exemplaris]|uniref:Alpha-1,6-mannosyl-glycoprotein 2-beta-N-acetylglucosaminyltransferase n=1 Tax=Hypsibius exemplaris TaxID=2072580 RepID=A0A9X6RN45_HYPEX|nr:Alpha-1,6-mannosyl-glycoprotein 2-beta-N-acetylglucosaminyltransferase [Hypsibius exemplaris]